MDIAKIVFRHLPHYLFAPLLGWTINKKQRTLRTQSWMLHVFWSLFKIGMGWYGSQSGYLSGHTKFGRGLQENHPCFGNPVILTPNAQLIPDVWWPTMNGDWSRQVNNPKLRIFANHRQRMVITEAFFLTYTILIQILSPFLVGGWATPLKNMKVSWVSWDDYSQSMEK
jgi:hypothetical protein